MNKQRNQILNQASTLILRVAILAIGAIVLSLCVFALPAIWRAAADDYPDITYVFYGILSALYAAAIPFFFALYQTLKLLSYIDRNVAFSALSVRALKYISYCGLIISIIFAAISPLFYVWAQDDDAPGLIVIDMIFAGASLTIAVFAAVMQRLLREAIKMKSENDLTV